MEGDASAYVSKCLAQLELYHLQPKQELLPQSRRLMQFFRSGDGMCITGAVGLAEVFTDDQDGRGDVGETCETVYQILFFDQLLQLEGKPIYGDFMERTIYNTLFAAQSLDGRRLRYYAPMEGRREYFTADTYCCPCNYRRLISKLPAMIYYQSDKGVAVNLYTSSEADFKLDGDNFSQNSAGNRLSDLGPCRMPHQSVDASPIRSPIAYSPLVRRRRLLSA